jgi:two-component system, NtrC family, nitrogen regulation response regulator GlnG
VERERLTQPPYIMGKSPKILAVFREIRRVATKNLPVLISGESGTYKELVARAIHDSSPRQESPFIAVTLSSIPERFAAAELFGGEKGTDTGSHERNVGRIREANGGTLFLDEISDLNADTQEKLFSFLQSNECRTRPGDSAVTPNVRMISATSKNLKEGMSNGHLRKDLCDLLSVAHIKIPPLRDRGEDILPIAKYFLKEAVTKFETGPKEFSKEAKDFLVDYEWPGNIRELENTVRKAVILSGDSVIGKKDLLVCDVGSCSIEEFLEEKLKRYLKEMMKLERCNLYETVLSEVEKSLIHIILKETGGNQLRAAKALGINRNTLRTKIKEYKIPL